MLRPATGTEREAAILRIDALRNHPTTPKWARAIIDDIRYRDPVDVSHVLAKLSAVMLAPAMTLVIDDGPEGADTLTADRAQFDPSDCRCLHCDKRRQDDALLAKVAISKRPDDRPGYRAPHSCPECDAPADTITDAERCCS